MIILFEFSEFEFSYRLKIYTNKTILAWISRKVNISRYLSRIWKFSNRFLGYLTGYFIIFSAVLFLSAILLISCIPKLSLFRFGLPRFLFFGVSIFSISILAFQLVHFEGEQPHTKIFCIILTQRQYKLPQFGQIQLTSKSLRVIYGQIKLSKLSKVTICHIRSFKVICFY